MSHPKRIAIPAVVAFALLALPAGASALNVQQGKQAIEHYEHRLDRVYGHATIHGCFKAGDTVRCRALETIRYWAC